MITFRSSKERGYAKHDWLRSYHSFSFADYYDPAYISFGPLRVINEDFIAADRGFGTHGHKNMEIITYVLQGEIAHQDSMGNGSTIRSGDVQRMSAGSGVRHSEFNPSKDDATHLLQIWIQPNELEIEPSYEEKHFTVAEKIGQLRLVASPDGEDGAVKMNQDARLYVGLFQVGQAVEMVLQINRLYYVHLARGHLQINGRYLTEGDALMLSQENNLSIENGVDAEVLVFDLPHSMNQIN